MEALEVARATVGVLLMGFLPGAAWTAALAPKARGLEFALLSVVLSVALVVLVLYVGSAMGAPIVSARGALGVTLILTVVGAGIAASRVRRSGRGRSRS